MKRARSPLLALLALLVLATAARAGGELGLSAQSRVYLDQGRTLLVESKADVPMRVVLEAGGGWTPQPAYLVLAPAELGAFTVNGEGIDGAQLIIRATAEGDVPAGEVRGAIEMAARVFYEAPMSLWPYVMGAGLLLVAILVAAVTVYRLRTTGRYRALPRRAS